MVGFATGSDGPQVRPSPPPGAKGVVILTFDENAEKVSGLINCSIFEIFAASQSHEVVYTRLLYPSVVLLLRFASSLTHEYLEERTSVVGAGMVTDLFA